MPDTPIADSITINLEPDVRAELDELARASSRAPSAIVEEAVAAFLDLNRWQAARIREGMRQARAGEFATDEEVEAAYAAFR